MPLRVQMLFDLEFRFSLYTWLQLFILIFSSEYTDASPVSWTTRTHSTPSVILLTAVSFVVMFGIGFIYCVSCKKSSNIIKSEPVNNNRKISTVSIGSSKTKFNPNVSTLTPVDDPTVDKIVALKGKSRKISWDSYRRGSTDKSKLPAIMQESDDYLP